MLSYYLSSVGLANEYLFLAVFKIQEINTMTVIDLYINN